MVDQFIADPLFASVSDHDTKPNVMVIGQIDLRSLDGIPFNKLDLQRAVDSPPGGGASDECPVPPSDLYLARESFMAVLGISDDILRLNFEPEK